MLRCGHIFCHRSSFSLPHSRMNVAKFTPFIALCVPLRPECVCLMARQNQFPKFFYPHFCSRLAFDARDVSQNILSFIRFFLYIILFLFQCCCVCIHFFASRIINFREKKCAQIKTHRPVTGYCICNFKLIYRSFRFIFNLSCNWLYFERLSISV